MKPIDPTQAEARDQSIGNWLVLCAVVFALAAGTGVIALALSIPRF